MADDAEHRHAGGQAPPPGWPGPVELEARHRLIGVGVDVVDRPRLERLITGGRMDRHVLHPSELGEPLTLERAARLWTAKEAAAKALGTGFWREGVEWADVRLEADGGLRVFGKAAEHGRGARLSVRFYEGSRWTWAVVFAVASTDGSTIT